MNRTDRENLLGAISPIAKLVKSVKDKKEHFGITAPISSLVGIIISILAAYVAWNCNSNEEKGIRIFHTILGFFFSFLYLAWYLFYHVMAGNKC
jgi:phosphoglycerol transferase MdoB-like AlkP superfamily enzyme